MFRTLAMRPLRTATAQAIRIASSHGPEARVARRVTSSAFSSATSGIEPQYAASARV